MQITLNDLTEYVELYTLQSLPDAMGGFRSQQILQRPAWALVRTYPCKRVFPLQQGSEGRNQKRAGFYLIGLRYKPDVRHTHYIRWRGCLLKIDAVTALDIKKGWAILRGEEEEEGDDRN